jgi:hypothetical protein
MPNDGSHVLLVLVDFEGYSVFGKSLSPCALAGVEDGAFRIAYCVLARRLRSRVHVVLYAIETPRKPQ